MKKDTTKTKDTKPECECGCGDRTGGGRFLPGHDARLKSALVTAALSGDRRAATKLEALGWTKFLDAKREKLGKKGPVEKAEKADEPKGRRRRRKGTESAQAPEAPRRRGRRKKAETSEAQEQTGAEQPS
jgi:hypothetical protein